MKKRKIFLSLILTFIICISALPNSVHAEGNIPENIKEDVDGNYWAELEYYTDLSFDDGKKGLVIPTYLRDYFSTSKVKWARNRETVSITFPHSAGIYEDGNQKIEDQNRDEMFWMTPYSKTPEELGGSAHPKHPDYPYWDGINFWNPYNFNLGEDLITEDTDYNAYGDITERNVSSTQIAEHKIGDTINLDFSVNVSFLKKWKNTFLISILNSVYPEVEIMENNMPETGIVDSDAELVFVLDLPNGLVADDLTTYDVSGLKGFTITPSKESNNRLVIRLRKNPLNGYETLKDYYKTVQELDTVTLNIDGLKITDKVTKDTNITATGYFYGADERVISSDNDAIRNKDFQIDTRKQYFCRDTTVFVAKQNNEGRDEAAPADKPNLISYTFKVNKPANNTVTFINEDVEYAKVKVETGKAIDNDDLTDESMPQNPTKSGYTFKEWNTQKDGKGTVFTGTTVVNEDTTVWAIYSKNAVVINEAPKLEVTDKTIEKGENLDFKELIVSATDKEDGDLKSKVEVVDNGGFDKDKAGKYTITFKVTDKGGASTTKKATVTVIEKDKPKPNPDNNKPQIPDNKTLPKTGDGSNLSLYAVLAGLSGLMLIAVGVRERRKKL